MTSTSPYRHQSLVPTDRPLRIVFMGTPDFAVPTLKALIDSPHEVVAAYSQPDRPKGRGKQLQPTPVKAAALAAGVPVCQPERMTTREALEEFRSHNADLAVVIAYGKILRRRVLDVPPLGCINCHASLLPFYRGAAPIQWAIARGEAETGVTTMLMDEGMDTGDMLLKRAIPIADHEEAGSLHDRLSELSAELMLETLEAMLASTLTQTVQEHDSATYSPMIHKQDLQLDFRRPAQEVRNWLRALSPVPGARALLPDKKIVKFYDTELDMSRSGEPGTVLEVTSDSVVIACGEGALVAHSVQWPGRKRMSVSDYLRGRTFPEDVRFVSPESPENS